MATYCYRCAGCGDFDLEMAMGRATPSAVCPRCSARARRVYTAPALSRTPAALARARAEEERSRDAPRVTSAPPPRPRRPVVHPTPHRPALPRW